MAVPNECQNKTQVTRFVSKIYDSRKIIVGFSRVMAGLLKGLEVKFETIPRVESYPV